jgi:hypothetical protein
MKTKFIIVEKKKGYAFHSRNTIVGESSEALPL